uniref:Uncharacterized protein n=1 Tax=Cacopsylla melanoneura TaxID=428564 RepID=A0A8D8UCV7_9HEMI
MVRPPSPARTWWKRSNIWFMSRAPESSLPPILPMKSFISGICSSTERCISSLMFSNACFPFNTSCSISDDINSDTFCKLAVTFGNLVKLASSDRSLILYLVIRVRHAC